MTARTYPHAVVVGGGFAGLVAARVLSDRFDAVTIVERDDTGRGRAFRRGTPQSPHPHGFLTRGADILEGLFVGLRSELAARGAPLSDFGDLLMFFLPQGSWSPRDRTGLPFQTFSRSLLESCVRDRVLALPNVKQLDGTGAAGLHTDTAGRVAGVCTDDGAVHGADLTVVATGRHSALPTWLTAAGLPAPAVRTMDARLSYASRLYERAADAPLDWQASLQAPVAPAHDRGGVAVAIEDSQWLVCLFGANGTMAPADHDGFTAYACSLANPHIGEVARGAAPKGPVRRYGGLGGQWHRYDRIRPWPTGLAVLGDAVCSLNPLYGQGMTVAALQAVLLGEELDRRPLPSACARFQRRSARALRVPWATTTGLDQGWLGNGRRCAPR
ncbi:FAD-dependent oxidoreductase [Streptomyces sp. G45]|uniref:FAD-dependent oxidoreductase n=1 Tax=Streptomyces sp. G45 TaxID=3406627 RepID=UPI003C16A862